MIDGRSIADGERLMADICIIGAGPVGITLARALAAAGISVVLTETGGPKADATSQQLNSGSVVRGSPHPPLDMYRERQVGGSSTIWGGRCIPFDPIDFEARDYVPQSGWPIPYREVANYYGPALETCEAGAPAFGEDALGNIAPFIEGWKNASDVEIGIERYSPPTNFARRYAEAIAGSSSLRLVTHATCVEFRTRQGGGHVEEAMFATLGGNSFTVAARTFVAASGGLETVRLLAGSNRDHATGLGNVHDLLGRYYMCHIEGTVGQLRLKPATRSIAWDFDRTRDGVFARRRLRLSDAVQRERELRNTIFRLHHANPVDPRHGNAVLSLMYFAKAFILPEYRRKITSTELLASQDLPVGAAFWRRHATNVLAGIPTLAAFVPGWIVGRHLKYRRLPYVALHSADGAYPLDFNAEQEPNADNRVSVTSARDHFGQRELSVAWRATEADLVAIEGSYRALDQALTRAGVGSVDFGGRELSEVLRNCGPVGGHHIGTTRMGASERDGVVDTDCRVHEVDNLYIAGAAVFPTCGHANPTLTALALALRLADHLKRTLLKRASAVLSTTAEPLR